MLNILAMIILIIILFIIIFLYIGIKISINYKKTGPKFEGFVNILILKRIKIYSIRQGERRSYTCDRDSRRVTNIFFWRRYAFLHKKQGNSILGVQARLFKAKSGVDVCVTIVFAAILVFPDSRISSVDRKSVV